jgi:hypothetical protein
MLGGVFPAGHDRRVAKEQAAFFLLPLMLGLLLFGFFGGRLRMMGYYGYGYEGCGGSRQRWHSPHDEGGEPRSRANPEEPSYTGKTTRL